MKYKFYRYILLFFLPIVLVYSVVEYLTRALPSNFKYTAYYMETSSEEIETLILGPSQIMMAVNPALMNRPAISLASGSQHHDSDFKLYQQTKERFPKLKNVVVELSYSHLEFPHNGPEFWKNTLYLEYYKVNNFERATYFKDRLLYLSFPQFFSEKLIDHYVLRKDETNYNRYGFDENNYEGAFRKLDYDPIRIKKMKRFKINTEPNLSLFHHNSTYFLNMIEQFANDDLNIVICTVPMYPTYLTKRNSDILKRRDSILNVVRRSYPSVEILHREEDTISFDVCDFTNQSHFNSQGAKKFTPIVSDLIDSFY